MPLPAQFSAASGHEEATAAVSIGAACEHATGELDSGRSRSCRGGGRRRGLLRHAIDLEWLVGPRIIPELDDSVVFVCQSPRAALARQLKPQHFTDAAILW